eukprot:285638-Chlamydomonas_euryale.AAC.1
MPSRWSVWQRKSNGASLTALAGCLKWHGLSSSSCGRRLKPDAVGSAGPTAGSSDVSRARAQEPVGGGRAGSAAARLLAGAAAGPGRPGAGRRGNGHKARAGAGQAE